MKIKVYLTTPVFKEITKSPLVSEDKRKEILDLWGQLEKETELRVAGERFPSEEEIRKNIKEWDAQIVGCHLSHPIKKDMLEDTNVIAVCTSTAGYNHIEMVPGILITHTPGVLHRTVADFTIAVILANLRNIINLHNFVWQEQWVPGQKWDLDENLSRTMDNLTLGIVGMGEIGRELTRRIAPWGSKILYFDIYRREDLESKYSNLKYTDNLEEIFSESDIVSIHVPLNEKTHHMIGEKLLKKMKKGALLVNTARGPIIDSKKMMDLLENGDIHIHLAFDVYEEEPLPLDDLKRYKRIQEKYNDLRFIFIPHNASADADTRAEMAIIELNNILKIARSKSLKDLAGLTLIPEQRYLLSDQEKGAKDIKEYRIYKKYWTSK